MVDGAFGEILTTCEKLKWTIDHGEQALQPEYRAAGSMMMHKRARVEYLPMGVLAAIIPWNYPFHNIFGQVISAVFAGNAIVIKVSEHACWSSAYYGRILRAALEQLGHDPDLVQLVTGYGETGAALINSGVDKLTFIGWSGARSRLIFQSSIPHPLPPFHYPNPKGSPGVGKLVMKAAADTLTPVVLELGGKDAAVVCEDCDFDQVTNMAMRGTFQNCGQNCCGLERLVVHERIYDRFVEDMKKRVNALTQGPPLDGEFDCGAMTMGERQVSENFSSLSFILPILPTISHPHQHNRTSPPPSPPLPAPISLDGWHQGACGRCGGQGGAAACRRQAQQQACGRQLL